MQNGWISLHRRLVNHEIYSDPYLLKLWIHCLMKASYTQKEQLVGRQVVMLEPGQFVTGRDALAKEYNAGATKKNEVSAITLWRWLLMFEDLEMLNIKKTTKYSVVTVVKWLEYQLHEQQMNNGENVANLNENVTDFCSESEQQKNGKIVDLSTVSKKNTSKNEQQMNSKRTANEQQMNTNNNINKLNNKDMFIQQAERQFDLWWDLYAKKRGKAKCQVKFKALLKKYEYSVIEEGTKRYLDYLQRNNIAKQYKKDPITFLNGEHFTDEYDDIQGGSQAVNAGSAVNELIINMDED